MAVKLPLNGMFMAVDRENKKPRCQEKSKTTFFDFSCPHIYKSLSERSEGGDLSERSKP